MTTTDAQRAAQARYDAKRLPVLGGRLTPEQRAWLAARALPGEKPFRTLCRLAGIPETHRDER